MGSQGWTFSLENVNGSIISIMDLRNAQSDFQILRQFGEPRDVIDKKDILAQTKEFIFDGISLRYSKHSNKWLLEYLEITNHYNICQTDFYGKKRNRKSFNTSESIDGLLKRIPQIHVLQPYETRN